MSLEGLKTPHKSGDLLLFPTYRGGLYKSCLVEQGGTFFMFYNTKDASADWREQRVLAQFTTEKNIP